jgi:hypothetical protein
MSLLDHPTLSARYFFPRRASFASPFDVVTADGARLACYRGGDDPARPTVVHFHGNGEVVADLLPDLPGWLAPLGCDVVIAEYRGYGLSTGTPGLTAMLADVGAVVDALGVPAQRLIFYGRSVGSIYAVEAARRHPAAAGLILESGIFDVAERVRLRVTAADLGASEAELDAELARRFDHGAALAGFGGRTLVLHTRHDEIVDCSHGLRLHAAAREPRTLCLFDDGGHNDIFARNQRAYVAAVAALIRAVGHDLAARPP